MESWQMVMGVAVMFIVRLGVPLAVTVAVGYWLRRLDEKWQAEAMARRATALAQQLQAQPQVEILKVIDPPCWVTHNCSEAARKNCPACQNPNLPCWLARIRTEGRLPAKCYNCYHFIPRRREVAVAAKHIQPQ